jgi:hypothetical protein
MIRDRERLSGREKPRCYGVSGFAVMTRTTNGNITMRGIRDQEIILQKIAASTHARVSYLSSAAVVALLRRAANHDRGAVELANTCTTEHLLWCGDAALGAALASHVEWATA